METGSRTGELETGSNTGELETVCYNPENWIQVLTLENWRQFLTPERTVDRFSHSGERGGSDGVRRQEGGRARHNVKFSEMFNRCFWREAYEGAFVCNEF